MDAMHILGAAFFTFAAMALTVRRRALLDWNGPHRSWGVPLEHRPRIAAAFAARAKRDEFRTDYAGIAGAVASIGFAPLVLLTEIPFNTVLGALLFAIAAGLGACFAVQRPARTGGAARAPRLPGRGVPWFVWTIVSALAAAPLLWLAIAPIGATLFASAGLAIVALAHRFAVRPFRPSGIEDPSIETFVEGRVRTMRVALLCAVAVVPGYAFEASTPGDATFWMRAALYVVPLGIVFSNVHIGRAARLMRAA